MWMYNNHLYSVMQQGHHTLLRQYIQVILWSVLCSLYCWCVSPRTSTNLAFCCCVCCLMPGSGNRHNSKMLDLYWFLLYIQCVGPTHASQCCHDYMRCCRLVKEWSAVAAKMLLCWVMAQPWCSAWKQPPCCRRQESAQQLQTCVSASP